LQAAPAITGEIPFQYREGMLWLKVNCSQSEKPLNFLLDTGAGMSVINLDSAKRIGLKLGRKVTVNGVGKALTGYWEEQISAKAASVQLPNQYVAVDLQKLSKSCQQPVDGLIGMDFFLGRIVQIDFAAQKIRLLADQSVDKTAIVLRLELRPCGMRLPVTINGHGHQWVRLDTGCATPLQWVTKTVNTQECAHRVAIGLAEVSIPQTKTSVELGRCEFDNVPTGLHESPIFPGEAGLLGNGLLARFSSITIDTESGFLILSE
jgi:predicted aspartyl protease